MIICLDESLEFRCNISIMEYSTVSCPSFVLAMYKPYHRDGIRGNQQINDTYRHVHKKKKIPRFPPVPFVYASLLTYTCSWVFLAADNGH